MDSIVVECLSMLVWHVCIHKLQSYLVPFLEQHHINIGQIFLRGVGYQRKCTQMIPMTITSLCFT